MKSPTPEQIMRIMKVKAKSVNHDANGTKCLRYVMGSRFKKNGYTHIQYNGAVHTAHVRSGIVWIDEIANQW
jgi:hypothetical protein